jgi:hypothetical protein
MSFQTIVDISQNIAVNNRRTIGQQYSRSGQVQVAQYLTTVPWVFTITPHEYLYYPQARAIIQSIDNSDRQLPQNITFASTNLSWFTAYQGSATLAQAAAITLSAVPPANSQTITLGNLPAIGSTLFVFKAGDFIQIGVYVYKITENVLRGSGSTVTAYIHRPIIGTVSTGTLAAVGSAVVFPVLAQTCPSYTLIPMTAGAFVQWDSAFVFREYITG